MQTYTNDQPNYHKRIYIYVSKCIKDTRYILDQTNIGDKDFLATHRTNKTLEQRENWMHKNKTTFIIKYKHGWNERYHALVQPVTNPLHSKRTINQSSFNITWHNDYLNVVINT